ncbi:MAG: UDP-glucose/GDP-mannose dehydrogenase family protein [Candidatus Lindowbacteria bacterium]|nr:UDP-glucose/GDP-mannose dehydrogenase family protein [Candidatus Lindowbacteria bacterium]
MSSVAIVGAGYVGLVSGTCLAEVGHTVYCIDNNEEKIKLLSEGGCPIYEPGLQELLDRNRKAGRLKFTTSINEGLQNSEIIFIAVNTPPRDDGSADLSYVENVAREIAQRMADLPEGTFRLIVDKSTVPVETADKVSRTIRMAAPKGRQFAISSNPEFLREGTAVGDFLKPDRIVVGVENPGANPMSRSEELMRELYKPFDSPLLVTDIRSAEIIKHASNAFLATKISFINAVSHLAEAAGADIKLIAKGMGLDPRIGMSFLCAGLGYGGSCFPKDVQAFYRIARDKGVDMSILREVEKINEAQRQTFLRKVSEALWVVKDKKIAVWGLSFKPNTDDMRSAPSIDAINALVEEGAHIIAYDPAAMEKAKDVLPKEITYAKSASDAIDGADALLLITEWDEFQDYDLDKIKTLLKQPLIIDGRNVYDPIEMKERGFVYYSMGRPTIHAD